MAERRTRALGAVLASVRGLMLVWSTSRGLTTLLALSTVVAGAAPAAAAYMARVVVDAVVHASTGRTTPRDALIAIGIEAILVALVMAANRGLAFCQALLKVRLAHAVSKIILDKATTLRLSDFEDAAVHDRLDEARREAAVRPLSLVLRSFTLARYALSLVGYVFLLLQLSPWAVLVLVLAGLPSFLAEARFSQEAFRFFRRHSPENRERHYVETLLTREEYAKEIGFFGLGPTLLARYDALFARLYDEDRRITVKRHLWGLALGSLATFAFFGAYVWIVLATIEGRLTLGQMTMYLVVFRQGQAAVTAALAALAGIYEDALYVHNLDVFLAHPVPTESGVATEGPDPHDGLRVEGLTWTYPGQAKPALQDVSFHVPPSSTLAIVGHNGGGKSTLVKLLTRRYVATEGRILLDGLDLREWSDEGLRARVSVLFQDYTRYKLSAGENIGAGDPAHFDDEAGWQAAARVGLADELIESLPEGYHTRLGRAFRGSLDLSGGQWQRLAFARALMRRATSLLIFDEPASSADPQRQAELDAGLRTILAGRMGVIVSHRLVTARLADRILVLHDGRVVESGTHDELIAKEGRYARLFMTQASAYERTSLPPTS